jgi:hypothetical protein
LLGESRSSKQLKIVLFIGLGFIVKRVSAFKKRLTFFILQ